MADRITPTQAGVEKPMGEGPEAKAASAVLDDLESLRNRGSAAEQQRDEYLALLQRTLADFENSRSAPSATRPRSGVMPMLPSPVICCRSWTTCNAPWTPRGRKSTGARWPREWTWCGRNYSISSAATV